MPTKLEELRVKQLNQLLRTNGLPTTGTRANKIAALMEVLETDEVEEDEIGVEPWEAQIDELRLMIANLTRAVGTISNVQRGDNIETPLTPNASGLLGFMENGNQAVTTPARHTNSTQEIVGILPEFDPIKRSLSSGQFIQKVEQLQRAYGWNDESVLFAVQHKLKGFAKSWLDSQPVFGSWIGFSTAFRQDFPDMTTAADVHRELQDRKRLNSETLVEYYYTMLNLGRRGNLDDCSIISYVINGINDSYLVKTLLSSNFIRCNDLLLSLQKLTVSAVLSRQHQKPDERKGESKRLKCYNCNEPGHISVNCSKPQRKERCNGCHKMGHNEKECRSKSKPSVANVEDTGEVGTIMSPPIMKQIKINDQILTAFVDTGSVYSLIKSSLVQNATCQPAHKRLQGFGGSIIEVHETVNLPIEIDDEVVDTKFYIISDDELPYDVLLGRDLLCRNDKRMVIEAGVLQLQEAGRSNFTMTNDIDDEQRRSLLTLLAKFENCFAENIENIGRCQTTTMTIEVTTDKPILGKRYMVPFSQREILSNIITNLVEHKIIRPSTSPHAASALLAKKANGEFRMCVDFRALNAVTVKKQYPMPVVEEQLSRLAGNTFFTTLDMTSGYYQIPLDEKSKTYTAFITHEGLFEHNVMPFGLVNAPMVFQEMIVTIIKTLENKNKIISYVDEVIIASKTPEEGIIILNEFLEAIRKFGLTLRPSKCTFLNTTVNFLGHIVGEHGIRPGTQKTQCIHEYPSPKDVSGVRRFLGITGFFRKFIPNYSLIATPLTKLLKKNSEFIWNEEQEHAFKQLKYAITSKPILTLYDPNQAHEVHTDASSVGLSGVLFQREGEDLKPVFYYSRQTSDAERKYASHELEVLATVETLQRFRMYLLGKHFIIVTDCNAVVTTKATNPLPPRIARWLLKLQEFNYKCMHRAGSQMSYVDGMSRSPTLPPAQTTTVAEYVLFNFDSDWIMSMQLQDPKLKLIVDVLKGNDFTNEKQIKKEYLIRTNRLFRKLNGDAKLVIPQAIRWRITRSCHDEVGHFGVEKTMERVSRNFWFPRMRCYIKSYIQACPDCCLNKAKGGKPEAQLHVSEVLPIPFRSVHIDHLGPFPRSKSGNIYIIVLVCTFSKYTILKALRNTKTKPALNVIREMMTTFGQPLRLITDRGTAFTSKEFEQFVSNYGIHHIQTAVRTPRANGQAERVNRTLLSSLKCTAGNNKDWDQALPNIQWSINSQRNSTTKFSPNDLVFNYNPRDFSSNRMIQALDDEINEEPHHYDLRQRKAADNITEEKRKWKERFDRKHQAPRQYHEGDLVVIDHVPGATGTSHKLEPLFKGPYTITKVLNNDRYVIEDLPDVPKNRRRYVNVFASDHIKPWCGLPNLEVTEEPPPNYHEDSSDDEPSGKAEL